MKSNKNSNFEVVNGIPYEITTQKASDCKVISVEEAAERARKDPKELQILKDFVRILKEHHPDKDPNNWDCYKALQLALRGQA